MINFRIVCSSTKFVSASILILLSLLYVSSSSNSLGLGNAKVREHTHAAEQFKITALLKQDPLSVIIVGLDNTNHFYYRVETDIVGYSLSEIDEILASDPRFARIEGKLLKVKWRFHTTFSLEKINQDDLGRGYILSQINTLNTTIVTIEHAVNKANLKVDTKLQNLIEEIKKNADDLRKAISRLSRIHSLRYAISQSYVSASSLCAECTSGCRACPTSVFRSPHGARYGNSRSNSYITFRLSRNEKINFIDFHLWDDDSRTYIYSIDYSLDGNQWISIRHNY